MNLGFAIEFITIAKLRILHVLSAIIYREIMFVTLS